MATRTPEAARALGEHALQGWRKRVVDAAAPRIAKRTPMRERDIRALIGLLFIALAIRHVVVTLKRFARER
jgi:hypothetical protein